MKRDRVKAIFVFLAIAAVLSACAYSASEPEAAFAPQAAPPADFDKVSGESADFEVEAGAALADTATNSNQVQVQERLIIRNGNVDVVVEDSEEALGQVSELAERAGGWVVNSELFGGDGAKYGTITIRIPADEFDATVDQIKEMAIEVRSESTNSQDVTEEYVDLSARLDNLEATAERVQRFLDQARNVEEALEVNRELSRLESEIESLKGRIQYLERSAAFSSLTIELIPDELSQPIEVAGWRPEGVAKDAIEALVGALQGIGTLGIWGLTFCLPLGLLAGIPLYLFYRFVFRRWRARRRVEKEDDAGEETGS